MRHIFLLLAALTLTSVGDLYAQQTRHQHSLFFELGGSGIFYTVNYDWRFNEKMSVRAGFGRVDSDFFAVDAYSVPVMLHYIPAPQRFSFELGVGGLVFSEVETDRDVRGGRVTEIGLASSAGFRYQNQEQGILFRIAITPILLPDLQAPWLGLSVGFSL